MIGAKRVATFLEIFCTKPDLSPRTEPGHQSDSRTTTLTCSIGSRESRVCDLIARRRAITARDRTGALVTIANAVISRYGDEKNRRCLLDYDDLIDKAQDLLNNVASAWVHYKLDRGIDHILIDEAQDTSPKQWAIVSKLAEEFFSGIGAHPLRRTIFAVGDEKQSIFSFQGAAPREFAAMRRHFESAHTRAELSFVSTEFKHSFRSGPGVLGAVDMVFARREAYPA